MFAGLLARFREAAPTASILVMTGVSGGVTGGVVTGGFATWRVGSAADAMPQPSEVVVADANVTGVRVVVRRPS